MKRKNNKDKTIGKIKKVLELTALILEIVFYILTILQIVASF